MSSDSFNGVRLTVAPMEGLTGYVFRRLHQSFFGGADAYYIPFVTPTQEPRFTERQLKDLAPSVNRGIHCVPQLLTRRPEDFVWAVRALLDMGYDEVNLNLGCPAGTVVAKGKGSGFLRTPAELDTFFGTVFDTLGDDIPVTVKTRLGWSEEYEFADLARIYSHHPIKRLIVHARLKTDLYKGDVRLNVLLDALPLLAMPLGVNGDIVTVADLKARLAAFPRSVELMVGRSLMADPALFRKARGGEAATHDEIFAFTDALLKDYTAAFSSLKNAVMRLKEYWFFQQFLFENPEKHIKRLFKARTPDDFFAALDAMKNELEIRPEPVYGWRKALG